MHITKAKICMAYTCNLYGTYFQFAMEHTLQFAMEHTFNLNVKVVTYTLICMTSYCLLVCQVKNVVGYQNSNKLT